MIHRHHHHRYLRGAALGTGLTALFLLVRCSVPERDYADLNIGNNAGNGGTGGDGGTSAGQAGVAGSGGAGGTSDVGGQGGQGGTAPIPIPCVEPSRDAGSGEEPARDAGPVDAGPRDAGPDQPSTDPVDAGPSDPCECVDGFLRAVDADGDGDGTRACTLAPGLDCDDGDPAVTHNSCGGCSELPATIGDDCLECGAYACDGPDAVTCASKPGPLEDPDCRCADGLIVARDTDGDGAGTMLCEHNAGTDCNDGNSAFITNACGGCGALPGSVGGDCNQCGVWTCSGGTLVCTPKTGASGQRCLNKTTRQTCVGTGFWGGDADCPLACYQGNCEKCVPGDFQCVPFNGSHLLEICITNASIGSSSYGIGWGSYASCSVNQTCDAENGQCTGHLLLPRDRDFDVLPSQREGLPWHELLNTASDSDYG